MHIHIQMAARLTTTLCKSVCVYVHTYVCIHTGGSSSLCARSSVKSVCVYVHTYIHIYTYGWQTYIHIYIYIYTYIQVAHIHIYTYRWQLFSLSPLSSHMTAVAVARKGMHIHMFLRIYTAILIIIEGCETAFNGFSTSLLLENR